jgi:hypothetical protein
MITDIKAWLDEHPTPDMIEQNPDGSDYLPIWVVENLLEELYENKATEWDRKNHQYMVHEINGFLYLSTSFELFLKNGIHPEFNRTILCGSMIKLLDYPDNSNWIATGIAEATKAGVKVLGNKFGKSLNARTVLKNKNGSDKKRNTELLKPDKEIRLQHGRALLENDTDAIQKLEKIYDFKI